MRAGTGPNPRVKVVRVDRRTYTVRVAVVDRAVSARITTTTRDERAAVAGRDPRAVTVAAAAVRPVGTDPAATRVAVSRLTASPVRSAVLIMALSM